MVGLHLNVEHHGSRIVKSQYSYCRPCFNPQQRHTESHAQSHALLPSLSCPVCNLKHVIVRCEVGLERQQLRPQRLQARAGRIAHGGELLRRLRESGVAVLRRLLHREGEAAFGELARSRSSGVGGDDGLLEGIYGLARTADRRRCGSGAVEAFLKGPGDTSWCAHCEHPPRTVLDTPGSRQARAPAGAARAAAPPPPAPVQCRRGARALLPVLPVLHLPLLLELTQLPAQGAPQPRGYQRTHDGAAALPQHWQHQQTQTQQHTGTTRQSTRHPGSPRRTSAPSSRPRRRGESRRVERVRPASWRQRGHGGAASRTALRPRSWAKTSGQRQSWVGGRASQPRCWRGRAACRDQSCTQRVTPVAGSQTRGCEGSPCTGRRPHACARR